MRVLLGAFFAAGIALSCAGCAQTSSWEHYDACAKETKSFASMVECGKRRRNAYCASSLGGCSTEGNNVVAYADSLVQSVNARQMTEPEAQRRWIDFKLGRKDKEDQLRASSGPVTCTSIGSTVTCY